MIADKTSLNVTYTDPNGKKATKAITDVNPFSPVGSAKTFCNQLLALTNNTLNSIEKIERTNITGYNKMMAYAFTIDPAHAVIDSFVNNKLEITLEYPDVNGGYNLPVVTGTKLKDSTITIEPHKITITLPDGDPEYDEGEEAAEMQVTVAAKNFPEMATFKGFIRIGCLTAADIESIA